MRGGREVDQVFAKEFYIYIFIIIIIRVYYNGILYLHMYRDHPSSTRKMGKKMGRGKGCILLLLLI